MKVVLVNYRYFVTSGAETFMFKFKKLLEAHGHTVIPFSTQNSRNVSTPYAKYFANARSREESVYYKDIKKTPANIYRMLAGAFWNLDAEKKLRRLLKDEKPDLVFVLQEMNALSPSIFAAAKKEGVPAIYRQSDFHLVCPRFDCLLNGTDTCTECVKGDYVPALRYKCVKNSGLATRVRVEAMRFHRRHRVYASIAAFVTPAQFTKNMLVKGGFPEEKIVQWPTFIDVSEVVPAYENKGYFIFFGRLSREKGLENLIRALGRMKHTEAKLLLVGKADDAYDEVLKREIEQAGVGDRVQFTGFVSGKPLSDLVDGAVAAVHPAIWFENMPNSILEAYAHGKPVISTKIGSIPEIVDDGKTGVLCEIKDAEGLAQAMDSLMDKPDLAEAMGRAAREKCEREYSPEKYYERFDVLCKQLLAKQDV